MMRRGPVLLLAAAMTFTLLACSDDSGSDSSSSDTVPEDRRASADEVATGLQEIDTQVQEQAAAVADGSEDAEAIGEEIHETWEAVEGTVQQNDADAYITFEDNFALLNSAAEDGDAEGAQTAADTVSQAVDDYLAAYPG
jgi:hypothetical protein